MIIVDQLAMLWRSDLFAYVQKVNKATVVSGVIMDTVRSTFETAVSGDNILSALASIVALLLKNVVLLFADLSGQLAANVQAIKAVEGGMPLLQFQLSPFMLDGFIVRTLTIWAILYIMVWIVRRLTSGLRVLQDIDKSERRWPTLVFVSIPLLLGLMALGEVGTILATGGKVTTWPNPFHGFIVLGTNLDLWITPVLDSLGGVTLSDVPVLGGFIGGGG